MSPILLLLLLNIVRLLKIVNAGIPHQFVRLPHQQHYANGNAVVCTGF